ncbi:ATP-grasp domain-containing protein [Clostridium paraputrificum]|uniref:ATP-grasp domain-containing protein n=1 Tax=Clostridium paraputrificum TaxID=29363 RepID=UPI00374E288C
MKKILIIGAGFLQAFIIKKAKEMGYYTIAIDRNSNSIGFKYANEYKVIDIIDKESCLNYANIKEVDGVITAATDYGVLSAAYVAEKLKLPGIRYNVAEVIKNKYKVRKILSQNSVDDINQYFEVSSKSEIDKILDKIVFPVMVKPCDGSGSKGAQKVNSKSDFPSACYNAIQNSLIGKALIEDFIDGKEYGVESFVENGQVHVLGIMEKYMTNPPEYAELGHSIGKKNKCDEKIRQTVCKAIKSLGINFGPVNMDILLTEDEKICIVDVGARMGGNLIGSHIIPLGTGVEYMENILRLAVGDEVDLRSKNKKNNVVTRLLALKPGKIELLPNIGDIEKECEVKVYHHLSVGNTIRKYRNNLDGMGYIVAIDDEICKAEEKANRAKYLIDKNIKRI